MKVCLKYCTPIAAVMFLATLWTFYLPGGVGLRSMPYADRNLKFMTRPSLAAGHERRSAAADAVQVSVVTRSTAEGE